VNSNQISHIVAVFPANHNYLHKILTCCRRKNSRTPVFSFLTDLFVLLK
jgi:hypothetical protein